MKFGAHVSIAEGIELAPRRAHNIGCECFQIFSRSPRGGKAPKLTRSLVSKFKSECGKYSFKEYYIHAPYFINLGSSNNRIYYGSISALREDLERGSELGAEYVMTHLGSARDLGLKKAMVKVIEGIKKILDGYQGKTRFLIEMSAGAGKIIGNKFEEIAKIIDSVGKDIGVCFDTAHAFESGYDLRTEKAVKKTFDKFDRIIGLEKLKLIHGNDSKTDLGSHVDRHEHIGKGKIRLEGFRAIINEARLEHLNMIIETPHDKDRKWDRRDLEMLKSLRK
jgi:deoxyribonuclease-4